MARAATARATAPAPRRAPQRPPRRAPRPARRTPAKRPPAPAARPGARRAPTGRAKAAARLAAIPHSPFVDRLLTGRAWIVLVAALLAGIVFANVALLEMNAGIARTTEKVAALKRENSRLRLEAAKLGSSERIQRAAADLGLVLPAPGEVRYLEARPDRDAALALKRMSEPEPVALVAPAPVAPAPVTPEPVPTTTAPAEPAPTTAPTEPVATETAPVPPATTPPPATTGQAG